MVMKIDVDTEPKNAYELLGLLVIAVKKKNTERALQLAKLIYKSQIIGHPPTMATSFATLAKQTDGELRALLLMLAATSLTIKSDPHVLNYVINIALETPLEKCNETCYAYLSMAFSDLYILKHDWTTYERAWLMYARSGPYKPVVAAWLPIEDEADLSKVEEEYRRADLSAVGALLEDLGLDMTLEEYKERMAKRIEIDGTQILVNRFLETGNDRYLNIALSYVKGGFDESRYLKGKILALLGRLKEAREEFLTVGGYYYDRARANIAVIDTLMGLPIFVYGNSELARLVSYAIGAIKGEKLEYVEEITLLDVILNAFVDISRGEIPERLKSLTDRLGYAGVINAIFLMVANGKRKDAARLLYFSII
ncbi:MAG: hypothetical protein QXP36_00845 [Conexivisphaerales archaeon]